VFELWDTRNTRLVGTFPSESAALDAAYRELRAEGEAEGPERALWAVRSGRSAGAELTPRGWARFPNALRRAVAPVRRPSLGSV
jgi:hypothetical protein